LIDAHELAGKVDLHGFRSVQVLPATHVKGPAHPFVTLSAK
jgi:hypothetical protein